MGFLVELAKNQQFRAGRFFEQFFDLFFELQARKPVLLFFENWWTGFFYHVNKCRCRWFTQQHRAKGNCTEFTFFHSWKSSLELSFDIVFGGLWIGAIAYFSDSNLQSCLLYDFLSSWMVIVIAAGIWTAQQCDCVVSWRLCKWGIWLVKILWRKFQSLPTLVIIVHGQQVTGSSPASHGLSQTKQTSLSLYLLENS